MVWRRQASSCGSTAPSGPLAMLTILAMLAILTILAMLPCDGTAPASEFLWLHSSFRATCHAYHTCHACHTYHTCHAPLRWYGAGKRVPVAPQLLQGHLPC